MSEWALVAVVVPYGGSAATRVGMRVRPVPSTALSERSKRSGSAAAAAIAATRSRSVGPLCSGNASTLRLATVTDVSGAVNVSPGRSSPVHSHSAISS